MTDEKRLHLMIALARFRQRNRDKALRINRFYQGDFISFSLIRNFLLTTIAYVLLLALIALYHLDFVLANLNDLKFRPLLAIIIVSYLLMLGIYSVIVYMIARIRFVRAEARMDEYERQLGRLRRMYKEEDVLEKVRREWGRSHK